MEDIINALLDVVRAQHTATQGTDEAPFNMDDIVDMAMNIIGRPDEPEGEAQMVETIENMVEELAPDIFPPKTFEQLDDSARAISAANMIQESLFGEGRRKRKEENTSAEAMQQEYIPAHPYVEEEEEEKAEQDPAKLNDLIYQNLMDMMGLKDPQIEYPFDRSQIRYGKEKSFTEQLEESAAGNKEEEQKRKLSAWELAQNIIDKDEEAHQKEPYVPQVNEEPKTKSASQLAAEAIAKSQEENKMKMEIEKRAEALMEEARKRGEDPMKFALHQQEILRYMEKNSDELVSFEDYEDLSPEEKLEIERQIQREKELEAGIAPENLSGEVPEEFIPKELKQTGQEALEGKNSSKDKTPEAENVPPVFTEEMLRKLSQEVIQENSDMILAEDANEDMAGLNEAIMENIMKMMSGSGTTPKQENVDDLLKEAAANTLKPEPEAAKEEVRPAEKPEIKEMKSAVELAKEAQAKAAGQKKSEPEEKEDLSALMESLEEDFGELDELDDFDEEEDTAVSVHEKAELKSDTKAAAQPEDESSEETDPKEDDEKEASGVSDVSSTGKEEASAEEEESRKKPEAEGEDSEEEYEYVDPDEMVLGEHTQAEIDEAMENLASLGLEGEVYERAKRMLLLELAGSEAELDAWLLEQENGKKKKANITSFQDEEDYADLDEDELEQELESALDEEFTFDEDEEEDEPAIEEEKTEAAEESADAEEEEESGDEMADTEEAEEIIDIPDESKDTAFAGDEDVSEETAAEEIYEAATEENLKTSDDTDLDRVEAVEAGKSQPHTSKNIRTKRNVVRKKERVPETRTTEESPKNVAEAQTKEYQVSVRNPFVLKNSASYMDKFEEYIVETQENRKLSTGFKKLDGMLRYGLHKGSYFIDAVPQYLKNSFMQQMADRAAESGVDVLYISTELSRYELMTDTISRLSYEMNGKNSNKAVSVMSIMTGEDGASLESLKDEMNWYRGRISEHLFILDQEAVDEVIDSMHEASGGEILAEIIRSIVRDEAHKPVVFIDNIENILSSEDSVDMEPLMQGIRALAKELSIPIVMSYGYAQAENQEERSFAEEEFSRSLGSMCDVYMELQYAPMITEDGIELTPEEIHEMVEDGDTILIDILLHRNRRNMRASCQIMATPQFNFFEE